MKADWPTPPKDPKKLLRWLKEYLLTHRAHQFTINGVTYPFVRELHFAALPHPINRRYSMLAGLFITRPGDLLFFFQADPQWRKDDINSRRGLRGIYRIISHPFADTQPISCSSINNYTLLGKCPHCGTFHANLSENCIKCKKSYPQFQIPSRPYHLLVLNLRLDIEPLIVFERGISDERTYADMSDPGMVWVGRHDNQMGPGKGSSIRQLLPEEAIKLTRLFLTEPGQKISFPKKIQYPNPKQTIINEDGTPASHLEVNIRPTAGDMVRNELMINFHLSCTIDQANSSIQKALGKHFNQNDLEYFSSEFPWGYTAGTSDFVCSFAKNGKRYKIIVMEIKKDKADDGAVIQTSLYVPWIVQVFSQFADPQPQNLEVVPVFIGRRLDPRTCIPSPYTYKVKFNFGGVVNVSVTSPIYIEYKPVDICKVNNTYYAKDIIYTNKSSLLKNRQINWKPPVGTVTSEVERAWVRKNSWAQARKKAGF